MVNGGTMLDAGSATQVRAAERTDTTWGAAFVANGPEVELRVLGASAKTVEWTVDVAVIST